MKDVAMIAWKFVYAARTQILEARYICIDIALYVSRAPRPPSAVWREGRTGRPPILLACPTDHCHTAPHPYMIRTSKFGARAAGGRCELSTNFHAKAAVIHSYVNFQTKIAIPDSCRKKSKRNSKFFIVTWISKRNARICDCTQISKRTSLIHKVSIEH